MTDSFPSRTEEWLSWGRVVRRDHRAIDVRFADQAAASLAAIRQETGSALAVGMGRSYGDSGLNPEGGLIHTRGLDRLMAFDPATGVLRAEAGITLGEILSFAVPRGYFLPTTPGTCLVTLGGAIANDVHGKNHRVVGTLGCWIRRIGLIRSDAGLIEIDADSEPELFQATIGGLGLTGFMVWAEIQLQQIPSSRIAQEKVAFGSIDEYFALARESEEGFEHRVAWIDCAAGGGRCGRGIYTRGNWSDSGGFQSHDAGRSLNVPFDAPSGLLNAHSLRVGNAVIYHVQRYTQGRSVVPYRNFFYPLDSITNWNRLYGRAGFFQYQSVVPEKDAPEATREMVSLIQRSGEGSFLVVLKAFGPKASPGMMSFPMPGTTLAMDFRNRGARTLDLLARLDEVVAGAGGRLYPAKDGRFSARMLQRGYGGFDRFSQYVDPSFSSLFWQRMTKSDES